MNGFLFLFGLLPLLSVADNYRSYAGYKVYEIVPKTTVQLSQLEALLNEIGYDFWKEPTVVDQAVHINVPPQLSAAFTRFLQANQLTAKVLIGDLGSVIDAQRAKLLAKKSTPSPRYDYETYHTLAEINQWIDEIAANYSSLVTVVTVGSSYEGRTIRALKISTGSGRRAFWIDSGIHSREWVAPATLQYIVKEFLTRYGVDSEVTNLLNTFDWYALPVFNVDGYEYTWTTDRLWRKTRSVNAGSPCYGTDPNRNWDVQWCAVGASSVPCSDTYCGASPFSEIEVRTVVDYLSTLPLDAYIAYHSYGQMYMTPYGYTQTLPADYNLLKTAGDDAIASINAATGATYRCQTIASLVGLASGSSVDYVYLTLGVTYTYGVELRDEGQFGFVLPENLIRPTAEESYQALLTIASHVISSKQA